jgi:hypothetical protein
MVVQIQNQPQQLCLPYLESIKREPYLKWLILDLDNHILVETVETLLYQSFISMVADIYQWLLITTIYGHYVENS